MGARWGHCYENAYPMFFAIPALFEPHGLFIEGWITFVSADQIVVMEHGWCVSTQGQIIDPTIVLAVAPGQPVFSFPGVLRGKAELERLENELFPHVRFSEYGDDGMLHPDYRAAYQAAHQQARSLMMAGKTVLEVKAI